MDGSSVPKKERRWGYILSSAHTLLDRGVHEWKAELSETRSWLMGVGVICMYVAYWLCCSDEDKKKEKIEEKRKQS